jgi:hypothetical protein
VLLCLAPTNVFAQLVTYNALSEYADNQGGTTGVWRYQYEQNGIYDMTSQPVADPCWKGTGSWEVAEGNAWFGPLDQYDQYCLPGIAKPNNGQFLVCHPGQIDWKPGYSTVLTWTAPETQSISVNLTCQKVNGGGGDGVLIEIRHNSSVVQSVTIPPGDFEPRTFTPTISVNTGDAVRFVVNALSNNGYDQVGFNMSISSGPQPNRPPVAVISASVTSILLGEEVTFYATGSTDPDGDQLTYSWDFGDGHNTEPGVQASTIFYLYTATSKYRATLLVEDGRGGISSAALDITVELAQKGYEPGASIYKRGDWSPGETTTITYGFEPGHFTSQEQIAIRAALATWGRFRYGYGGRFFNFLTFLERSIGDAQVPIKKERLPKTVMAHCKEYWDIGTRSTRRKIVFNEQVTWLTPEGFNDAISVLFQGCAQSVTILTWRLWLLPCPTPPPMTVGDIHTIALHEIGHLVGLGDITDCPSPIFGYKPTMQQAYYCIPGSPGQCIYSCEFDHTLAPGDLGGLTTLYGPGQPKILAIVAHSPVDIEVTTPMGDIINKATNVDFAAYYEEAGTFGEGLVRIDEPTYSDAIVHYAAEPGEHRIRVIPEPQATNDSLFSLSVFWAGQSTWLVQNGRVGDIDPVGYRFNTLPYSSLSGKVQETLGAGLCGVGLDIYNEQGNAWRSLTTNELGIYRIDSIPNGKYTISVVTPLGYQADQETKEFTVNHVPVTVDFNLTKIKISAQPRARAYWAHQLCQALKGKPKDYTKAQFSQFGSLIGQHFNDNRINPVMNYVVPQPASQDDSLAILDKLLSFRYFEPGEPFLKRIARGELVALMLNVVAGKISQMEPITDDGMTVSQAITYCDMLVNDLDCPIGDIPDWFLPNYEHRGEIARYIKASFVAGLINVGVTLHAGAIPSDIMNIAYKYVAEHQPVPTNFELSQNYPNPFNPATDIRFSLPEAAQVRLDVYDILGRCIATLIDGPLEAGEHIVQWDGRDAGGREVASGIYFYRISGNQWTESKKMVLIR